MSETGGEDIVRPPSICVCGHPCTQHSIWLKHSDVCNAPGCKCHYFVTPEEQERARLRHEEVEREIASRSATALGSA